MARRTLWKGRGRRCRQPRLSCWQYLRGIWTGVRRPTTIFFQGATGVAAKAVFVLGDSISIHYGPYLKRMLHGILDYDRKREAGQTVDDLDQPVGANGEDSRKVLEFLRDPGAGRIECDVLLLNSGLHDLRTCPNRQEQQVPLGEYRRNLRSILQLVGDMGVAAMWVRTTPVDDERHNSRQVGFERYNRDVIRYNAAADEIVGENQVPVVDLYTFTRNLGDGVYCDHVHFTDEVRALQAAFIAGHLVCLDL